MFAFHSQMYRIIFSRHSAITYKPQFLSSINTQQHGRHYNTINHPNWRMNILSNIHNKHHSLLYIHIQEGQNPYSSIPSRSFFVLFHPYLLTNSHIYTYYVRRTYKHVPYKHNFLLLNIILCYLKTKLNPVNQTNEVSNNSN